MPKVKVSFYQFGQTAREVSFNIEVENLEDLETKAESIAQQIYEVSRYDGKEELRKKLELENELKIGKWEGVEEIENNDLEYDLLDGDFPDFSEKKGS